MSKIVVESELMKNHKAAAILPAQSAFACHQTQGEASIFLAISDAGVFNLIKEQSDHTLGWVSSDLCSGLSTLHPNKTIQVKTFASQQNYTDGNINIAAVVTAAGDSNTYLYVATNLSNADNASWMSDFTQIGWQARPYNDNDHPVSSLTIANVYLTPQQKTTSDVQLVCEVIINNFLQNYTVNLSGSNVWTQLQTAENFSTLLDTTVGKASSSAFAGLYQLTSINGSIGLNFIPFQSFYGPPTIIKMIAPDGATKIASLTTDDVNNTNLFVAASGAIYLFTPSQQVNNTGGVAILTNSIITGLQDFYAHQTASETILWGLNQQGQVFYTKCSKGQETNSGSWSVPVPILTGAERISSYIKPSSGGITIFAHTNDRNIIQLSQDTTNSLWQQRNILLPPPDLNAVIEYTTYTSHLLLTDDNNLPLLNTPVTITAVNQCSVYINNTYYILSPTVPLTITPDTTGNISIVQETQTLGAVCYKVTLMNTNVDVNPMSNLIRTISAIGTRDDLNQIHVDNGDGTKQLLVGSSIKDPQKDATVSALKSFMGVASNLPANGSAKTAAQAQSSTFTSAFVADPTTIWGVSYLGDWKYHEGQSSLEHLRLTATDNPSALSGSLLNSIDNPIVTAAGDLWNWLKQAYNDVTQFFVKLENDIYHFFIEIGGLFYRAVVTCINDVVQAVEFVFNKIAVAFEDLIKWLGYIFNWGDIVRTHSVLKTIIKTYLSQAINNLSGSKDKLKNAFNAIETYVANWANIPSNIPPGLQSSSRNGTMASASQPPGINSPQSNWGISQAKNNASAGNISASSAIGDIETLLQPLLTWLEYEKDIFQAAYNSFKTEVIDKIDQLSFIDLIKAIVGIIANVLLESIENMLLAAIDVFIKLTTGIVDFLNSTIEIPVISWLYKEKVGDNLSILDLVCLIAAIPTTIVYKMITGDPPFPDDATTNALKNAPDFATVKAICNGNQSVDLKETTALSTTSSEKTVNQKVVLAGGICSLFGAIGVAVFGPLKTKFPNNKVFPALNGGAYLVYVLPDIMGQIPDLQNKKWWAITNEIITDICVVKAAIDLGISYKKVPSEGWNAFSPWFDFGSNIIWQVPTEAAIVDPENQNTAGILSLWAGTCFDCSGILSPVLADAKDPVTWGIAVGVNAVLNAGYGAMSCASSVLNFQSDN